MSNVWRMPCSNFDISPRQLCLWRKYGCGEIRCRLGRSPIGRPAVQPSILQLPMTDTILHQPNSADTSTSSPHCIFICKFTPDRFALCTVFDSFSIACLNWEATTYVHDLSVCRSTFVHDVVHNQNIQKSNEPCRGLRAWLKQLQLPFGWITH